MQARIMSHLPNLLACISNLLLSNFSQTLVVGLRFSSIPLRFTGYVALVRMTEAGTSTP
jgi:hypothetical protein